LLKETGGVDGAKMPGTPKGLAGINFLLLKNFNNPDSATTEKDV
jgi:hypothetical protein